MRRKYYATLMIAGALCAPFLPSVQAYAAEDRERKSSFLEELLSFPITAPQELQSAFEKTIFNLGEIQVSGSRLPSYHTLESAARLPHNITVIGPSELEGEGREDVPELLSWREGVTYTDELGDGSSARVDLRGFGGEGKQALVLFDGVRAVEPFDNSMAWHLFPTEYFQRIEVQRGGATVYGEGAFSGVVRMQTKEPGEKPMLATEQAYGSFGFHKHFVEASGKLGATGAYAGGRYAVSDGYRQNADKEDVSALFKLTHEFSDVLTVGNTLYFADDETGIPGPLSPGEADADRRQKDPEGQFGDQFSDKLAQNAFSATLWLESLQLELANLASVRRRDQNSVQSFGGAFGGTSVNDIATWTYADVIQASRRLEGERYQSEFIAGAEWSKDDMYNPFTFDSFSFGPFGSERAVDRRMMGLFAENRTGLGPWSFETGIRQDWIDWDIHDLLTPSLQKRKSVESLSPKFAASYRIFDALTAHASYSEAFKAPDTNTLIFETPNLFTPNPEIDPSIAKHRELGLRYAHPEHGSARLAYFWISTKKEILFNAISTLNENFDTERHGAEAAVEWALWGPVQGFANATYTSARFDNGTFDENRVPLVPDWTWNAGLRSGGDQGWNATLRVHGEEGRFALNDFNNRFRAEDYVTVAAKLSYKKGSWEAYVRGENLLSERYSSFSTSNGTTTVNVNPSPEFTAEAGIRFEV